MFISPMLLQKADLTINTELANNENYITELKADGLRLIYSHWNGVTRLYSRHSNELTQYKKLAGLKLPPNTILDGELISPGENGGPNFEALMETFHSSKSSNPLQILFFDVIYLNGEKVTQLPLLERKKLLDDIVPDNDPIFVKTQWMIGHAAAYFEAIKEHKLEGIVVKEKNSQYTIGKRSFNWLKVINYQYQRAFINGIRKGEFGAFLTFENGKPAGMIEFMKKEDRLKVYDYSKQHKKSETADFVLFDVPMPCNVKYRNLTSKGKLRIPSLVSWV